jgi:hypothetical protein
MGCCASLVRCQRAARFLERQHGLLCFSGAVPASDTLSGAATWVVVLLWCGASERHAFWSGNGGRKSTVSWLCAAVNCGFYVY